METITGAWMSGDPDSFPFADQICDFQHATYPSPSHLPVFFTLLALEKRGF